MCYAAAGENQKHAVLGAATCNSVQPSDLAPALVALGAEAEIASPAGTRMVPVERLFRSPTAESRRLTTLNHDEILTAILVPAAEGGVSTYVKKMERKVWTFATASLAAWLRMDGDAVEEARLVFGGVSQVPWRLESVERMLVGRELTDALVREAATASTAGARPLRHNAYKVRLAQAVVEEALAGL